MWILVTFKQLSLVNSLINFFVVFQKERGRKSQAMNKYLRKFPFLFSWQSKLHVTCDNLNKKLFCLKDRSFGKVIKPNEILIIQKCQLIVSIIQNT